MLEEILDKGEREEMRKTIFKRLACIIAAALAVTCMCALGCSSQQATSQSSSQQSASSTSSSSSSSTKQAATAHTVTIHIGDYNYQVTLEDNKTAQAFAALLPKSLTMSELGGASEFVRKYTLASGGPYCDCGYRRKR